MNAACKKNKTSDSNAGQLHGDARLEAIASGPVKRVRNYQREERNDLLNERNGIS